MQKIVATHRHQAAANMTPALAFVLRFGPPPSPLSGSVVHSSDRRRPLTLTLISSLKDSSIILDASASGEGEEWEREIWPGFARYAWTISPHLRDIVDTSQLADLMLEFGAASASVVPANPIDVADDETFARTGKISLMGKSSPLDCSAIEFWILEYDGEDMADTNIQANSLARDVLASLVSDEEDATSNLGKIHRILADDRGSIVPDGGPTLDVKPDGAQTLKVNGIDLSILSSLDSKWAFGDGLHPSTSLSIQGLEDFAFDWSSEQPFSLLDYGCGSGILTLVGLALGADDVTSVDISDDALYLTEKNLKRNEHIVNTCKAETVQVLKSLDCGRSDWEESFDLVVANIPSNTLIKLLPTLARAPKEEAGVILTSGYPTIEQEAVVKAANNCGLEEEESHRRYESGWVLQVFGVARNS
jgi:ribosomal protein L11 methylase PrmA